MGRVRQTLCVFVFSAAEDGAAPKHGLGAVTPDTPKKWAVDLQRAPSLALCLKPLTKEKAAGSFV